MELDYYKHRYPYVSYELFEPDFFSSTAGYNRLMLNDCFYARFVESEFLLIAHTDALVLRDELDYWLDRSFDYIGAPWPSGLQFAINVSPFEGVLSKKMVLYVGNGGLTLRRISACRELLKEFNEVRFAFDVNAANSANEDVFFSFMGQCSRNFKIANERTASYFALELGAEHYLALNQGTLPMGIHAWMKYTPQFWRECLARNTGLLLPD